jgi:hypothetical protein
MGVRSRYLTRRSFAGVLFALGLVICLSPSSAESKHEQDMRSGQYQIISEGLLGSVVIPFQFKSAHIRLEVRDLIMGTGSARFMAAAQTILEVRGGTVVATINGKKTTYIPGDFFVVNQGSVLDMQNPGDVTVIRAIYIFDNHH